MDPVTELYHLCVNTRAVLSGTSLAPAHDPSQEPPPASLQTDQRTARVALHSEADSVLVSVTSAKTLNH